MPNDFKSDHPTWTCSVIDRLDNSLPFSRGLLATSILATGIDTPSAYEVARVIQERLYRSGAERIDSEALIRMTAEEIARLVSNEVADRYLLWRKARRIATRTIQCQATPREPSSRAAPKPIVVTAITLK